MHVPRISSSLVRDSLPARTPGSWASWGLSLTCCLTAAPFAPTSVFSPFNSLPPRPHSSAQALSPQTLPSLLASWGLEVSAPLGLGILLKPSRSKFYSEAKMQRPPRLFSQSLKWRQWDKLWDAQARVWAGQGENAGSCRKAGSPPCPEEWPGLSLQRCRPQSSTDSVLG